MKSRYLAVVLFFSILLFGCNKVDYKVLETDGNKMLIQEWKGTDTIIKLVKAPIEIRGKYLSHKLIKYHRGYGHDYYPVIYVLCGNDTLILNGRNNDIPNNATIQKRVVEVFNPGDSILIRRQYYPYNKDDIEYIFKK